MAARRASLMRSSSLRSATSASSSSTRPFSPHSRDGRVCAPAADVRQRIASKTHGAQKVALREDGPARWQRDCVRIDGPAHVPDRRRQKRRKSKVRARIPAAAGALPWYCSGLSGAQRGSHFDNPARGLEGALAAHLRGASERRAHQRDRRLHVAHDELGRHAHDAPAERPELPVPAPIRALPRCVIAAIHFDYERH